MSLEFENSKKKINSLLVNLTYQVNVLNVFKLSHKISHIHIDEKFLLVCFRVGRENSKKKKREKGEVRCFFIFFFMLLVVLIKFS